VELSQVYQSLGRAALDELVGKISLGTLKAYKMFDGFKVRAHLKKLNTEHLRKAVPRFWERLEQNDEELARELTQAILICNIKFVIEVLEFLKIPHDGNGFFEKGTSTEQYLTEGWQSRVLEQFRGRYPEALVRLYINHLTWETNKEAAVFAS
jgi:hypothetical protein